MVWMSTIHYQACLVLAVVDDSYVNSPHNKYGVYDDATMSWLKEETDLRIREAYYYGATKNIVYTAEGMCGMVVLTSIT